MFYSNADAMKSKPKIKKTTTLQTVMDNIKELCYNPAINYKRYL